MTLELKNIYEDLIQEMIIDGINGMTPEIKSLIQDAPIEKRRSMILTVLEENNVEHRLLCNKIYKTVDAEVHSEMAHIKEVVGMLREYVKVSKTEVKTMGEVMTPISLVEEMLDTLPYEVWTNPNLKWMDPCNGVGTFFSVVIERLMKGLISFEPDENLRYKHILENMIYACELQAKNLFLFLYAFEPKDEYALNIYNGSYLDKGFDKHMEFWGVEKFDVVVMNPPYQELKEGNKKSEPLWNKFVVKTIEQLVEGGYLVAVHPSGWRNVDGKFKNIQELLKSKQILCLEIHNVNDGIKTFGASTRYDFYCLHNVPNAMFTKIKCQDGTIERTDLSKMEFIPNGMFDAVKKLLAKNGEEKVTILHSRSMYGSDYKHMLKEQTKEFKYPCIQNVNVKNELSCIWYSNINTKGHFNIPKVIFGRKCSGVYLDNDGKFGMAQDCAGIVDNTENLIRIQQVSLNKGFLKILSECDFGGTQDKYNRKIIATLRKDFWKEFQY